MGNGGPLHIACFLVGADTSSGANHARMVPDSKKMDMPDDVAATTKCVLYLAYERFLSTRRQKEFFNCIWTRWQENVLLMDKTGKF